MIFVVMVSLCIVAWILTLIRIGVIHWKDVGKDSGIALNVWLMMVFFSITMIFLVKTFCNYFDAHTLNNLDRLISYSSILRMWRRSGATWRIFSRALCRQ